MAAFDPSDKRFTKRTATAPSPSYPSDGYQYRPEQQPQHTPQQYAGYPEAPSQYGQTASRQAGQQSYSHPPQPQQQPQYQPQQQPQLQYQNQNQSYARQPQYQQQARSPPANLIQNPYNGVQQYQSSGEAGQGNVNSFPPPVKPSQSPAGTPGLRPSGWSTGLFDCFSHVDSTCIMTLPCPCLTYGQNYEIISGEQGSSCMQCCGYCCMVSILPIIAVIMGCSARTKLRQKYNLEEDPFHDCIAHWLCTYCALCQENRECHFRNKLEREGTNPYQKPSNQQMTA